MRQRQRRMKKGKPVFLALGMLALMLTAGCEDGLRDGVNDGVSAALSAIIQAPVTYMIDQAFSEP